MSADIKHSIDPNIEAFIQKFLESKAPIDPGLRARLVEAPGALLLRATSWKQEFLEELLYRVASVNNLSYVDVVDRGSEITAGWLCGRDTFELYLLHMLSLVPCTWRNLMAFDQVYHKPRDPMFVAFGP